MGKRKRDPESNGGNHVEGNLIDSVQISDSDSSTVTNYVGGDMVNSVQIQGDWHGAINLGRQ